MKITSSPDVLLNLPTSYSVLKHRDFLSWKQFSIVRSGTRPTLVYEQPVTSSLTREKLDGCV